ncbi:MAG: mechanosensitive ion channel family protein [Candidatus Polarisedimenticolaceae bacterium]|nr:mechanosensitive ion channel family protein [Candidatus Polarisedimenticolaceae bacterium]
MKLHLPLLLLLLQLPFFATAAEEPVAAQEEPVIHEAVPENLKNPRAILETFFAAAAQLKRDDPAGMKTLISTLDLSSVNPLIRNERGSDLSWMLIDVMDWSRSIRIKRVPTTADRGPYQIHTFPDGVVRLSRLADGRWAFDSETIRKLPDLFERLSKEESAGGTSSSAAPWYLRIRNMLPESLVQELFGVELWRLLGIFVVVLVGIILDRMTSMILRFMVRSWRQRSKHDAYRDLSDGIMRPFGLMVLAVIWWLGLTLLGLPENVMVVLLVAVKFLTALSAVWAAYRSVDLLAVYLVHKASLTDSKLDDVLVPLVLRTMKVFVTIIGTVFIADNMNINVSSLLAGLGLGGLAFALAAKDVIQNLFGSITVLLDRTYHVGDWVIIGDNEGTVEHIGFRSTKLRTFYNSVVTLPNATMITASVDNMGERRFRRMKSMLGLSYDTKPEMVEAFCEGVRELVRIHPYMRKDYYHVYFNGFGASSLDILVYVFWETPDWSTELRERHRFLLDIHRLAEKLGIEFAFPTQTLYMRQEGDTESISPLHSGQDALELGRLEAQSIAQRFDKKPPAVDFPAK